MRPVLCICFSLVWVVGFAAPFGAGAAPAKKTSSPETVRQVSGQSDEKNQLDSEDSKDVDRSSPIGVFTDIEQGWRKSKVDPILRHFGKGKVTIAIEGVGGGTFSKSQSHYLLQDLFKYTITEKFEFVQYRNVTDGRVEVYAVAEREFKRNDDGRPYKDKIYVSLQLEDERWVISEIKSVR